MLAANLMAGNGCVLKHVSICTGSGLRLRELCIEAGLPEDLFQVIVFVRGEASARHLRCQDVGQFPNFLRAIEVIQESLRNTYKSHLRAY